MTLHLGLAALLFLVAGWGFRRPGSRRSAGLLLSLLALSAAAAEVGLAARGASLRREWEALAAGELEARAERIVDFLRDEGSRALAAIRATGSDADTRALLSSEGALARTARRPVFLDLMERFPGHGAGVTVYDAAGFPRAWSGWSATATMSLAEKPSPDAEIVEIREGNIYTILQVTHPIVAAGEGPADALGYVVYQQPLRVQFPLENRFLRVDDVLRRLEGGSGVRADVAFALSLRRDDDVAGIRAGALKLDVREDAASATAAIVSPAGAPVGRVTLSSLSRDALIAERLAGLSRWRAWLLLATGLLLAARLWFAVADRGVLRPVGRIAVVVAARFALSRGAPWGEADFLGVFDPSVYALNRFAGLARSPGDLALTATALVLIGRELRSFVIAHEPALAALGRRSALVAWIPGAFAALLVGSCAGLHWARTVGVARDANVPLYSGLDPFASAPAAALEVALLMGGAAFLLFGDALVRVGAALFARWPARGGVLLVWALAAFGAAVKIGAAADEASLGGPTSTFDSDLLRTAAAVAALFAFHRIARTWERPRAAAIFVVALLAQVAGFTALVESTEIRRRSLVELLAQDHVESPSSYRQFLIGSVLQHLSSSSQAREVLEMGGGPEHANLAFVLWGRSPLASVSAGCRVRILDAGGRVVSTFSLGFPPELASVANAPEPRTAGAVRYRREELGSVRVDLYSGASPITGEGRTLGAVEVAMAYFDDLRGPGPALASVFTNLTAPDELLGLVREVPDRIDRYRGETLVYSTDPEGGLGKRVPSFLVQALADAHASGRWVERKIGGKLYDLYCVRERDGEVTVGYLTFGIERLGPLQGVGLLVRSVLVALVLTLLALLLLAALAWAAPPGRAGRFEPPRIGFRERVIGGFLIVALLPTVFLGFAGRKLFVEEQLHEFQQRLEEDLRLSGELLGRRLADAARNAAGSDEVLECLRDPTRYRALSTPRSVGGIVVLSDEGRLLGASRTADLGMSIVPGQLPSSDTPVEFFRRRGADLYSCALVPVSPDAEAGVARGGSVLAFQRIDPVLAADLERRVGSAVSFFAGGLLTATSKPELYQSEILSDLAEPTAYLKIELEGARRTLVESRVGSTSFLASYAPLLDEHGESVGILSTLAAFRGQGLGVEAGRVLSNIYFVCLTVLAGAVAAAVLLANRLTRPISDLTRGAERIGAGGLGHVIATKAGGEIGALVRSFNSMSRRLAESEARDRQRREYIEAIIRNVGSGVISFDAKGSIATVNDAAARIVGQAPDALVGRTPADREGSAALGAVLRSARPLLAGERTEVVEEIEVAPTTGDDEQLHTLRLVGTPLVDRGGHPQGAVVVFEDLTELIRSKKIKAWAEMARQVAHEIKNPLTPMKLSAQQVLQAWKDQHPKFGEILKESTETIVDRCEALRRIAMEFSDYARMPGRKIRREDLGRLLGEARRLYALDDRSVEFTLDAPEGRIFTRVDRDEVMRLFINLIENSIQAMPSGGNLSVRAWGENGSAHVVIRDTGTGITRENLARIFEPSFSTKTGGAGLGLPICKAIMEDYGGTIDIESQPGDGTTVTLVFPAET